MLCPQCKANIDDRSNFCNRCGAKQEIRDDRYGSREYRSDQQAPTPSGIDLSGLNDKKFLLIALAFFAWALIRGIPAIIGLISVLPRITLFIWGDWHNLGALVSALFAVGLHVALPLILGGVFLRKHKDEERKN